jgi:molybdate transport system ATP-binding protein
LTYFLRITTWKRRKHLADQTIYRLCIDSIAVEISRQNVIISGFYDSIGMYTKYSDNQKKIADQWLALLGMKDRADQPFNKLSYGDQRLLLIARAMVKHPPLLILDEPCLGLDDMNRQLVLALIEKICQG